MYRLLYSSFKFWYDWYRPGWDGDGSMTRTIVMMVVLLGYFLIGLWNTFFYLDIGLGNQFVMGTSKEKLRGLIKSIIIVLFFSAYFVLKWIIRKNLLLDPETGLSERYTIENKKKYKIIGTNCVHDFLSYFSYFLLAQYCKMISIVIPFKNNQSTVVETIGSVKSQSFEACYLLEFNVF